jgi:hemerythrin superfamily protein
MEVAMSVEEDLRKAEERPDDVIAAVFRDHAEIKRLFGDVTNATDTNVKRDAFERLVRKLVVHETAEQEVVHPLVRETGNEQATEIVEQRMEEEQEAETMLAGLDDMDISSADFDARLAELQADVIEHAEAEEEQELPLLESSVDSDRLRQLKSVFNVAEHTAPTRPRPEGPTSATGNVVVGPALALADRVRDAIRDVRS